ncbi:hypothetical protein QKV95_gp019 [Poseidoniales virus YSH_150918]|uniref:Uncharacterized protein n=1 Tax=Poseidoniales virus YSH_150918 TaxID=3071324 RepID=A0A976UAU8_9CAUD|nr:hypothetical protein QKV95_gp019 [Yangshan Harbor Poseidoniales virus]UVF62493.1 hypothetical protein [Poseidoniales virus YSH_150918]
MKSECRICKKPVVSIGTKKTSDLCRKCFQDKRLTKFVSTKSTQHENKILSIENRILQLENRLEDLNDYFIIPTIKTEIDKLIPTTKEDWFSTIFEKEIEKVRNELVNKVALVNTRLLKMESILKENKKEDLE